MTTQKNKKGSYGYLYSYHRNNHIVLMVIVYYIIYIYKSMVIILRGIFSFLWYFLFSTFVINIKAVI